MITPDQIKVLASQRTEDPQSVARFRETQAGKSCTACRKPAEQATHLWIGLGEFGKDFYCGDDSCIIAAQEAAAQKVTTPEKSVA